jgi:hypothetical protein
MARWACNSITKYENRIEAAVSHDENAWALAGEKAAGETAVLLSCFNSESLRVIVNLADGRFSPDKTRAFILDADHDLTPLKEVKIAGNSIVLDKPAGSAVFLVESQIIRQ